MKLTLLAHVSTRRKALGARTGLSADGHCLWKAAFGLCAALLLTISAHAQAVRVSLATILPRDVPQDFLLRKMAQDWQKASGGAVMMSVAPGGPKDGEATIVKKLNSRNYQAAVLSAVGLSDIEPDVAALQMMPLTFRSWAEVDYTRDRIRPKLEQKLLKKGFVVLFWADAGWVNFFSTKKATTPEEFKAMPLFSWAGDADTVAIMKSLGYRPIGLETDNIHTSFASGMIEAAPIAPVFAQGLQIPTVAKHVLDIKWAPIVGACIIRKDVWDKIDPVTQKKLLVLCDKTGAETRAAGRRFNDEALATIAKTPGSHVYEPTPEEQAKWEALAVQLGPKIRGKLVPAPVYDEVQQILKEFRAGKAGATKP